MTEEAELYDGPERRATGRFATSLDISLRETGHNALQAKVSSLSHLGCTVTGVTVTPAEGSAWIRLPGLESQLARQRWSQPGSAGYEFDRPLYPAVADRYNGRPRPAQRPNLSLVENEDVERPASRREQILSGRAHAVPGLTLTKLKGEAPATLAGLVRRHAARVVDHRHEHRFAPPAEAKLGFRAGGQPAGIRDLSPSGVQVETELAGGIGASVKVAFAGFDPLEGTIVWVRQGASGVRLPENALELSPEA